LDLVRICRISDIGGAVTKGIPPKPQSDIPNAGSGSHEGGKP
jgi:hypothetical protein